MGKRERPVHGGNREREQAEKAMDTALFYSYSNTNSGTISSFLEGRREPITAARLAEETGVKDARRITRAVEAERKRGVPICASCDTANPGYYLAVGPDALQAYIRQLTHRLKAITQTREALQTTLDQMTGQTRLDLDETEGQL